MAGHHIDAVVGATARRCVMDLEKMARHQHERMCSSGHLEVHESDWLDFARRVARACARMADGHGTGRFAALAIRRATRKSQRRGGDDV